MWKPKKKKTCAAMINACAHVHTSQGKCPIDDYRQQYFALPILDSRLNTMNASYCNHQPLEKSVKQMKP